MTHPKVIIDDVEYVPKNYSESMTPNKFAIAKALVSEYWGECSDDRVWQLIESNTLKVLVHDGADGTDLKKILDIIMLQTIKSIT